ncbi:multiple epidermal growth factor-like domains protein 10 [Littorina saxatilis]|uniref:multiple epidermal growth factor-like domains protein 10 n=1 Tax=Littorina saxatilis TaxID=31220 RepID=UPI0038B61549
MTAWDGVRVVFCVFFTMLLRVHEMRADEVHMCSCGSDTDGGCVANQPCGPGGNCNKENVAYGKQAEISSRYPSTGVKSGPACVAVNGRTGHMMKFPSEDGTNCVHTEVNDNDPWWQVDLGQNYTVTDITIYSRQGEVQRLAGIRITIDDKECKKLPPDTYSYSLNHTTACDTPLRGQVVKLSKVGITDSQIKIINFCEVQIWVCRPGLFGQNCDQSCHCRSNVTCDNYSGKCPNGNFSTCENKTYGENCREQCGRCDNSAAACDVFNGSCQACQGNFDLPSCTGREIS